MAWFGLFWPQMTLKVKVKLLHLQSSDQIFLRYTYKANLVTPGPFFQKLLSGQKDVKEKTDGQMDIKIDRQTDRQMDRHMQWQYPSGLMVEAWKYIKVTNVPSNTGNRSCNMVFSPSKVLLNDTNGVTLIQHVPSNTGNRSCNMVFSPSKVLLNDTNGVTLIQYVPSNTGNRSCNMVFSPSKVLLNHTNDEQPLGQKRSVMQNKSIGSKNQSITESLSTILVWQIWPQMTLKVNFKFHHIQSLIRLCQDTPTHQIWWL